MTISPQAAQPGAGDEAVRGRPLRFGISVTPTVAAYPEIVAQVLAAERGGLDLVGIQDHPYQRRFLDTFALIADLLARTKRLRFFPDVASLPMRPPPMLAKAAASLDVMSAGRFELGLGDGVFWDAVAGMGGSRRRFDERVEALEEAVTLVRAALDVGPEKRVVRGAGPHCPIVGYPPGPPPVHRVEMPCVTSTANAGGGVLYTRCIVRPCPFPTRSLGCSSRRPGMDTT